MVVKVEVIIDTLSPFRDTVAVSDVNFFIFERMP